MSLSEFRYALSLSLSLSFFVAAISSGVISVGAALSFSAPALSSLPAVSNSSY